MITEASKAKCRTCGVEKPLTDYWRQNSAKSGRQTECKVCCGARNMAWIAANRERFNEASLRACHRYRQRDPKARLFAHTKNRARKQGIPFAITIDDLPWSDICPILGVPLASTIGSGKGSGLSKDFAPSVDRIDNTKGYVPGNVVVVSWRANRIKSDATADELRRIADFYGRLATEKDGQANLPGVQPSSEEEARSLLVGIGG